MIKRGWIVPILIVAANAFAVLEEWSSLPELLSAHFNLKGEASGTMYRSVLLLYPLMGALICLSAYLLGRKWNRLQTGLVIMASGVALVLLSSTMVSLTGGRMPLFMLAEPVIMLASIVAFVFWYVKSHKNAGN